MVADGSEAFLTPSTVISEPHQYFPEKIRRQVREADSVSPKAEAMLDPYPTIDIQSWIDPAASTEEDRQGVVRQVLEQAISTGSFNIIGHDINDELLDRLEASAGDFFCQSLNDERDSGDVANQPQQDVLDEYAERLRPIEMALNEIFSTALSSLRAHRYIAMPREYEDADKLAVRGEFDTLKIIYGKDKGLEEIRDGRWVEVPMNRGELHVAVGEAYTLWSNELLTNNIHRLRP